MSHTTRTSAAIVAAVVAIAACTKVPYTGRSAFTAIPEGQMVQLGAEAYAEVTSQYPTVKGTDDARTLKEIGQRIATVAERPEYDWTFRLLDSEELNAFCMPGGYIAFYTGILPALSNKAGMSSVMGHEVGHAVARHSAERMTQQLGLSGALSVIDMVLSGTGKVDQQERGLIMGALGLGAQYGAVLPFSRAHEKEADVIGLMYMAEAGYPPKQAIGVWERMSAIAGNGPPAFLSTHPSHATRIENIEEWLPQASKKFRRADKAPGDVKTPIW